MALLSTLIFEHQKHKSGGRNITWSSPEGNNFTSTTNILNLEPRKWGSLSLYNETQSLYLPSRQICRNHESKRVDNKNVFMVTNQLTFQS